MENELRQPFQTGNTAVTSYRGTVDGEVLCMEPSVVLRAI